MSPLLAQFLVEAREQIAATTDGLLGLERDPHSGGLLNAVFRSVHTLKGSSGLFDIPALTAVLHAGEDLLVALREHRLVLDPAMLDQILAALDLVSAWLDHIEDTETLPDTAAERGRPVIAALRAWLDGPPADGEADAATDAGNGHGAETEEAEALPRWLSGVPEDALMDAAERAAAAGAPVLAITYRPEPQCFFKGDDPLALMTQVPERAHLAAVPPVAWSPLAEYDPFSCVLSFQALSTAPRKEVAHLLRYVGNQSDLIEIEPAILALAGLPPVAGPAAALAEPLTLLLERGDRPGLAEAARIMAEEETGDDEAAAALLRRLARLAGAESADRSVLEPLIAALGGGPAEPAQPPLSEAVLRVLDEQRRTLEAVRSAAWLAGSIGAAAKVAANALRFSGRSGEAERMLRAGDAALNAGNAKPLLDAIAEVLDPPAAPKPVAAPVPAAKPLRRTAPPASAAPKTMAAPSPAAGSGGAPQDGGDRPSTVLRVDQGRIDALMNLIGELVVAKNGLPFLARRAENVYGSREMAREIKEQHAVIDRIALELRNSIMQVRMLPVSTVFQRFPRLVRDLSRKLNKHVDLVIEGEETQADKTVIENLFEPILHLVRNSLDHGFEADRAAAGKPETARLTLGASQDNDQVIIRIADDGRGIDPAVMREKAVEKGLMDRDAAQRLSDGEAINLIFAAGFSTAAAVTDVSGRGVGMDAVRTAIEKTGGRVELTSVPGTGTTVSLHLPLSMAVTRVMTLEVSGRQFGIPMDEIAETVRIPRGDVVAIKDKEAFLLRDRIIPLVHLDRLLDLPPKAEAEEVAVLVVRVDKQAVGLAIEAFGEGMEVIVKPLDGPLSGMPGYLGTALLGDGRVLLVMNLKELVE
ncbi:chemotaxis protein CheA [Roseomonas genomospecies 6]|uniref:Chemotaxis protein CheA n=1 Tax=Roseomonas genomospecies 6 TaxID=214106 RepID=A0A9W7NJY0_9PROT|nr:chemotaxis protein CheA [Roseomonas genomospecies 6]KAA0680763.1 chemotaxis protein CheA [Roseomonas genomospecies 6]